MNARKRDQYGAKCDFVGPLGDGIPAVDGQIPMEEALRMTHRWMWAEMMSFLATAVTGDGNFCISESRPRDMDARRNVRFSGYFGSAAT